MKLFEDNELLTQNMDFDIKSKKGKRFFCHKEDRRVITDEVGHVIWHSLPGSIAEIKSQIKKEFNLSDQYLNEYLYVLLKANIIHSSHKEESRQVPEKYLTKDFGLVSVIVVTYNGMEHIDDCFSSIADQSYKNIEIIAVDNASKDETVQTIKKNFPQVLMISLSKNKHYSGGVNTGIQNAKGKYFFVLNQDVKIDKDCVFHLASKMEQEKTAGAVVPMMKFFYLDGFINGIGNQIRHNGWGSDNFIGHVNIGQFEDIKEVPSACFGAVFLRKKAVDEAGLLDSGYQSFYEDVDWSFRSWMRGWRIIPEIKAIVYHKFGASFLSTKKLKLVARNRQRLILKLFQKKLLPRFLKSYFKEDLLNSLSLFKRRKFVYLWAYISAYLSLFISVPGIFVKRIRFKKKELLKVNEIAIFEKNPIFYSCVNELNEPEINSKTLLGNYRWEFLKMKNGR